MSGTTSHRCTCGQVKALSTTPIEQTITSENRENLLPGWSLEEMGEVLPPGFMVECLFSKRCEKARIMAGKEGIASQFKAVPENRS